MATTIPLLLTLLLVMGLGQAGSSEELPAFAGVAIAADKRQPAVVMVLGYNPKTGRHQQATGFFIDPSGAVVTNYHVVDKAEGLTIWSAESGGFPVTGVIGTDIPADLAVLAVDIPSQYVHPATIAGQLPTPGDGIEVVGHPLGQPQTSTRGTITSLFPAPPIQTILQFSAPITTGESGSPLFNDSGQVVGVASFILYLGEARERRYFAIPATRLLRLWDRVAPAALATTQGATLHRPVSGEEGRLQYAQGGQAIGNCGPQTPYAVGHAPGQVD